MAGRATMADDMAPKQAARFGTSVVLALVTARVWATFFPVSKPIVAEVDPFVFVIARFVVIAAGLLLFAALKGENLRLKASDIPSLFWLAVLGFGLVQSMTGWALALTTASKGAVIMATAPAFGVLFGRMRGEATSGLMWIGVGIAFAGVFLVINNSLTAIRLGGGTIRGDLLYLIVAALFALYTTLSRDALIRHGALKAGGYLTLLGTVTLIPSGIYGAMHGQILPHNQLLWINFLVSAVVSGLLGFAAWYTAIARAGVGRVMIYYYLVPVLAVLGSVLFLREPFSMIQVLGGVLVLGGVILARRGTPRQSPGPSGESEFVRDRAA
jgi:O-acetylserine/cysteine efflux transporter